MQTGPFGSQLHASDYVAEGIPSIMPQNIGENRIVLDGIARISDTDAKRLSRYRVRAGDIVYSRRGDVERRALVRSEQEGWLCGTGCLRVRFGGNRVDPWFASYYLGDPRVRRWIVDHAVGATMPNLNTAILGQLPFLIPPAHEQNSIAALLGALDDKIELNRRMNETLEALFSTIVLGSHKGEPTRFSDLAENRRDIVNPTDMEPGTPYIALEHMPRRSIALTEWGDASSVSSAKSRVRRGDILFGKLRPYFHKVGIAPCDGVCSTDILVIRPKSPDLHPLALAIASSDAFVAHATATSTGTKMPRASWRDLAGYEFHAPDRERLSELNPIAASLLERIDVNIRESRTLAALRDALLPKLISGELRIRDAERAVEPAI